jgi:hypothetical protein
MLQVWISKEDSEKLQQFLDKFSAGDLFLDQLRNLIHWLGEQTEGIDKTKVALKFQHSLLQMIQNNFIHILMVLWFLLSIFHWAFPLLHFCRSHIPARAYRTLRCH